MFFFLNLHTEVSRSWDRPFSAHVLSPIVSNYSLIMGLNEHRYAPMLRVEEALANYLSPESASPLKALTLPTNPCRTTSSLVGSL